ncbi:MAG: restriction endonuclease subunit S [Cypionkella sp.]|uniref:restriction endonuclease subunit S n=1 Tax=Cypionkella sp. TaxID=2811411 RepID=UPI002ABA2BCD|nr:restriction endonuclease subunit S [Cypionkella sp.]MDZ4309600.1 restriction endonuclease subunit S [Cypionkella sp.]
MKAGWKEVGVSEVVTLNYGKSLAQNERNADGAVPVYGANGVMDWSDRHLTTGPSLVVGRKGSAGEITRVDGPFWPSDVTYFTTHDQTKLDFDFLHYAMRTLNLPSMARGVKPGINRNDVYGLTIPLPPLEEQQLIVAVLDEAFEGLARARAHAQSNLRNTRELFESIKADALRYDGGDSATVTLDDVTVIASSLVDPREETFADMLHLGAGNMVTGSDLLVDVKTAREEKLISGKYTFDENTVLYSKIRPYLRKAARPDFSGLCSADVYPLTPKAGRLDRDYLFHLLLGHDFTEYAISGSDRAGMPKVNRDHMFRYAFALPPMAAQQESASRIDAAQLATADLEKLARAKLEKIDALRQSFLEKAFAGELT